MLRSDIVSMCLTAHCRVTLHYNDLTDLVFREFAAAGRENDLHHLGVAVEEGGLAGGPPDIVLQADGAEGLGCGGKGGHLGGKFGKFH